MKKVLVTDDCEALRVEVVEMLDLAGFIVFEASNGQEALDIAKTVLPDLILSDIEMPVMNGLRLLQSVRQTADLCQTKVIFWTATQNALHYSQAKDLGVDGYLLKPVRFSNLLAEIQKQLEIDASMLEICYA